jgi:hypothetical protein
MPVRLRFYLLLAACVLAGVTRAQELPPEPKFAVEVPRPEGGPPSYVLLRSNTESSLFYDTGLHRLTGRDPKQRQPAALKLDYKVEDESVLITASVYFGNFDRQNLPASLDKLVRQKVGAYSAGLNESVTLSEMEQVGLEPLTLRIVSAQQPVSVRPRTISNAPSIQMEIVGEDRVFCTVALHNLSAKAVKDVRVYMPVKNGSGSFQLQEPIAPGATYQRQISIRRGWTNTNGGYVEDPPFTLMILQAAIFQDGSYEGDRQIAVRMVANRIGFKIQAQRVIQLVSPIVADAQFGDDAKIARIRSEVDQLTEETGAQMVESVRSQFPGLSEQDLPTAKGALEGGMDKAKRDLAIRLDEFERTKANPDHPTLAKWWSEMVPAEQAP